MHRSQSARPNPDQAGLLQFLGGGTHVDPYDTEIDRLRRWVGWEGSCGRWLVAILGVTVVGEVVWCIYARAGNWSWLSMTLQSRLEGTRRRRKSLCWQVSWFRVHLCPTMPLSLCCNAILCSIAPDHIHSAVHQVSSRCMITVQKFLDANLRRCVRPLIRMTQLYFFWTWFPRILARVDGFVSWHIYGAT